MKTYSIHITGRKYLLLLSLQSPFNNTALVCPIEEVLLNYTVTFLDRLVDTVNLQLPPNQREYTIAPIRPGTAYSIDVSFVNEVGESVGNPIGEQNSMGNVLNL